MSEPVHEPAAAGLQAATRRRAEAAERAALEALRQLRGQGKRITVAAVARQAGVSPRYLYSKPHLLAQITGLRAAGAPGVPLPAEPVKPSGMISVLKARIDVLEAERRQLRERVGRLEHDLAVAHGEIIELRSADG